jgi:hypothetical protein
MTDSLTNQDKKNHFTKRSYAFRKVPNAIEEMGLKPIAIAVWGHLASHKKGFNPTIKNIAKLFLCGGKTIERTISILEKMNMLVVVKAKGRLNHYEVIENIDRWVQTPETVLVKNSTDIRDGTVQTLETVGTDIRDGTSTVTRDCHKRTSKRTRIKEQRKEQPATASKPSKFKFEDWQFDLAKKWIQYHQEHFPGTNPKPEQWANQIRIICSKRKHLNQESFPALLNSIQIDSFWCDKATSLLSLNKPSKSNPDVLKVDQVLKGLRPSNKKPDYSIDDMFVDELKAMRENTSTPVAFDINNIGF